MLRLRNKVCLLLLGLMGDAAFILSSEARAAPPGGGSHGATFRFAAHNATPASRMASGIRRGFPFHRNDFFSGRGRRFFVPQFVWPFYWYPYYWSDYGDIPSLDYGSDYDYRDSSAAPVQAAYSNTAAAPVPVIVVINQGTSAGTSNGERTNGSYGSVAAENPQRSDMRTPNEPIGMRDGPLTLPAPESKQATPVAVQPTPAVPQAHAGAFGKLVLVSWLNDEGKDVIFVQNTETNEIQRITSEPNKDKLRIVEVHPSGNPSDFEAIISNGSEQGPVRFRF